MHNDIPFFIIYYSGKCFEKSLISLLESTNLKLRIYIVNNRSHDNNSNKELKNLSEKYGFDIINCSNRWVLSMNNKIIQQIINKNELFLLSDDDIIYPIRRSKECWIKELFLLMEKYKFIGKLGIDCIDSDNTHQKETCHEVLPEIIPIGVDTTPAIYRKNLFIPNNTIFNPRHMSMIKPELLNCQIKSYQCRSLSNKNIELRTKDYMSRKAFCFTICSAWLSKDNLLATPFIPKIFYLLFRRFFYLFWAFDSIIRYQFYILRRILRH